VEAIKLFLEEKGVKQSERVAFIAKTHPASLFLFFALFRIGAIACPLSTRMPQEQIPHQLRGVNASHFFSVEDLPLKTHPAARDTNLDLKKPATFLFTSGSSGTPKIACHTLANHYFSALGALEGLELTSSSRWHLSLPLFHVGGIGILFRCFVAGACIVLGEAIDTCTITHLSQVPTQLYRLLGEPEKFPALKRLLLGGAPAPLALLEKAKHLPIYTTYGMTEMSSLITLSERNPQSAVGIVLPYRDIKIGADQEIYVRGDTLFAGYWDTEEEKIVKVDGWFATKDLGRWTSEGSLEIIGRKDRQFISGGENIQPEEIERALCSLPGIERATVIPLSDPEFGERPIAFIEGTPGYTLDTVKKALGSTLPAFKHPVRLLPYPPGIGPKPPLSDLKNSIESQLR
jgi:o-succinylbenzoate---CoA ligase